MCNGWFNYFGSRSRVKNSIDDNSEVILNSRKNNKDTAEREKKFIKIEIDEENFTISDDNSRDKLSLLQLGGPEGPDYIYRKIMKYIKNAIQ